MDINNANFRKLFRLYSENRLTKEQYAEFWFMLNNLPDEVLLNEELKTLWEKSAIEKISLQPEEWKYKMDMLKTIVDKKDIENIAGGKKISVLSRFRWTTAAAAVFLGISFIALLFVNNRNRDKSIANTSNTKSPQTTDVSPGSNKAVLILGDGSQIILDSADNGVLAKQGNTNVIKQQDGQLVYSSANSNKTEVSFNTLSIPKGGQYKLTLPDGSKIWLNAASSLKYPTAFTGKERRVQITGEAYFEVSKDVSKPFIVQINDMEVEVLGTHFNINSYDDEEAIKTTLLEGSVKVKSSYSSSLLKPGQQAQVKMPGKIKVINDADLEGVVAWKDGNFQFENADIAAVMRQLSRWYNVEVVYEGNVTKHFGGSIARSVNLSKVLHMLEQTGEVKFIIAEKKIIVKP